MRRLAGAERNLVRLGSWCPVRRCAFGAGALKAVTSYLNATGSPTRRD